MKLKNLVCTWLIAGQFFFIFVSAMAQGTAFTYQGRLDFNGSPANGSFDFRFKLFIDPLENNQAGSAYLTNGIVVANGQLMTTLDFGAVVFNGTNYWLDVQVRTNGGTTYTDLTPLQPLTPTPYAIFATAASNLSGTLPASQLSGSVSNSQLANDAITITVGVGLSGGGPVALGGATTVSNTGVLSVTGNSDISITTTSGAVKLGDSATNINTASAIVKRDVNGSFSASSISLTTNLTLPATTASAGIIFSGANTLLHSFGIQNFFAGVGAGNLTLSGSDSVGVGFDSLHDNTTGQNNTGVGWETLNLNTTGSENTALGQNALHGNTTGGSNSAVGENALANNTTGANNSAIGQDALRNNTTGSQNTAAGQWALLNTTTGSNNTASGWEAMISNITGANNTSSGGVALVNNTIGSNNLADGFATLPNITNGNFNIAVGFQAGLNLVSGGSNIYIGNTDGTNESSIIRIGENGIHTNTFIAGITGTSITNGSLVLVSPSGQLGAANTFSISQLPTIVVTNNERGVTLTGAFSGDAGGLTNVEVNSIVGGLTTNIAVFVPGAKGAIATLVFTNGILTGVQ